MTRPAMDLRLYVVADTALCGTRTVVATILSAVRGGATAVQVREPLATTRQLCQLAETVHHALASTGVPLLVNDRLDVALAVGAEGVHLGQSDLPATWARRIAGPDLLVGLSVSNLEQTAAANALPAGTVDYLGVGPVFATLTKPLAAPALGLELTARLAAGASLPCVAIGGIHTGNAAQVRATGVDGIAVVSAVCAAPNPEAAAAALCRTEPEQARR
jgi:thiamine-phosphate pyrophosphorylase